MAVRMRLRRVGVEEEPDLAHRRRRPRSPRDGRTIETIGSYNPRTEPSTIVVDADRAQHWLDHGAQPVGDRRPPAAGAGASRRSAASRHAAVDRCATWSSSSPARLVDEPDAVKVEEVEENGDIVLEITVAEDDVGRVIGRGGRIANAIRTLAKAAAVREDRRVIVDILE